VLLVETTSSSSWVCDWVTVWTTASASPTASGRRQKDEAVIEAYLGVEPRGRQGGVRDLGTSTSRPWRRGAGREALEVHGSPPATAPSTPARRHVSVPKARSCRARRQRCGQDDVLTRSLVCCARAPDDHVRRCGHHRLAPREDRESRVCQVPKAGGSSVALRGGQPAAGCLGAQSRASSPTTCLRLRLFPRSPNAARSRPTLSGASSRWSHRARPHGQANCSCANVHGPCALAVDASSKRSRSSNKVVSPC